ncbi:MAG: hypothetical protein GY944_02840 [bacterium]|nr:hypothetical protein [bacterium]
MSRHELTRAALLGTQRKQSEKGGEAELDMLNRCAVVGLRCFAGRTGHESSGPLVAPVDDDRSVVSERAVGLLAQLLTESEESFLRRFLALADDNMWRLPERSLPKLLELCRQDTSLRGPVLRAGGPLVEWLANQNQDWRAMASGEGSAAVGSFEDWDQQGLERRRVVLGDLRATDPDQGRDWLTRAWAGLDHKERSGLLSVLRIGLSIEDEALLEPALDDRRKEVRRAASDLLASLPDSRLVARMIERLRAVLSVEKKLLAVEPPIECDKAMVRDGVDKKPPRELGERAHWLRSCLGVVPPSVWCKSFDKKPAQILKAVAKSDWQRDVHYGLTMATMCHGDAEWALVLLDHRIVTSHEDRAALIRLLPVPERQPRITKWLGWLEKSSRRDYDELLACISAVDSLGETWDVATTKLVAKNVTKVVRVGGYWGYFRDAVAGWTARIEPKGHELWAREWTVLGTKDSRFESAAADVNRWIEYCCVMNQELER